MNFLWPEALPLLVLLPVLALAVMIAATARPSAVLTLPSQHETVMRFADMRRRRNRLGNHALSVA